MGRAVAVALLAAVGFAGAPLPSFPLPGMPQNDSDLAFYVQCRATTASRGCDGGAAAASSRPRCTCWLLGSPIGCC